MASFSSLKATLAEIPIMPGQTRYTDPHRLKSLAHKLLTHSRSASGRFRPELSTPYESIEPIIKFPWLLIGLLDKTSPREVTPADVQHFLSNQSGCIAAVDCHPDNLEEVTAAFRPAIEEAHRQCKAKRSKEERAREEEMWMLEEEIKMSEDERRREVQSAINRMKQFEQWFGCLAKSERKGRL